VRLVVVKDSVLKLAMECAAKSDYYQKVGAVIFNKKSILSSGRNNPHRSIKSLHPRFMKWSDSIHAEVDAIIKARRDLKGLSLLVVRINNNGELRLAKPCKHCLKYIQYVGIKTVYYSTSEFPFIQKLDLQGD
jgi:deoxycytidylate deaminase